jgi:hypothetical protein
MHSFPFITKSIEKTSNDQAFKEQYNEIKSHEFNLFQNSLQNLNYNNKIDVMEIEKNIKNFTTNNNVKQENQDKSINPNINLNPDNNKLIGNNQVENKLKFNIKKKTLFTSKTNYNITNNDNNKATNQTSTSTNNLAINETTIHYKPKLFSKKGILICDNKQIDSEVIYWKIVEGDNSYESPITPHHDLHHDRYVTFEYDQGGLI